MDQIFGKYIEAFKLFLGCRTGNKNVLIRAKVIGALRARKIHFFFDLHF